MEPMSTNIISFQISQRPEQLLVHDGISTDNLTTACLVGASLVGFMVTKRMNLSHHGFGIALGSIFIFDYMQRR